MEASKITSLTFGSARDMTVRWNKPSGAAGYQVKLATKKNMSGAKIYTFSSNSIGARFTKMMRGRTYYVQVRAFFRINGVTKYNNWSSVKSGRVRWF